MRALIATALLIAALTAPAWGQGIGIPQPSISGSGTATFLPKWSGAKALGSSSLSEVTSAGLDLALPGLLYGDSTHSGFAITISPVGGAGEPYIEMDGFGIGNYPVIELVSARGTQATPTAIKLNDTLGLINFLGKGTTIQTGGYISFAAAEDFSVSNAAASFVVTTRNLAQSVASRLVIDGSGNTNAINGALSVGPTTSLVASESEAAFAKRTASGTAPGAGNAKISWVAGTNAGTCKLISYAGTSTTPVTIIDNVGAAC